MQLSKIGGLVVVTILCATIYGSGWGEPVLPNSDIPIALVLDDAFGQTIPSHFRTTKMPYQTPAHVLPTREGLDNLQMAGSGQFSELSLQNAVKEIGANKIWVIDLRQESHGFVNGIPLSWYAAENNGNAGESDDNILRYEGMLLNDIRHQSGILVGHILEKQNGNILKVDEHRLKVETVTSEYALTQNYKLNYLRIGVQDHHAPEDNDVDNFLEFFKTMPEDGWIYFHCRGGKGRTTTFMIMMDMLRNASTVSLLDIVNRQALLGGSNLFTISQDPEDAWKKQAAIDRKEFITDFYDYAQDKNGYPKATWTEWKARQTRPFNRFKRFLRKYF